MQPARVIDILIITALREEYDQVLAVEVGAFPGSSWQVRPGPLGHEMAFRVFAAENGQPLSVAVTWATSMGAVASASLAERLIAEFLPRCLAMCGVCAGRRGDVNIGDVIIGDRLWMYDTGKLKVEHDNEGKHVQRIQGDLQTYNLRADWKKAAESFLVPESMHDLLAQRPRPVEMQANWILERIVKGEDPRQHAELDKKAPDFGDVLELLWKKNLVDDATLQLTDAGKKHIDRLLLKFHRGLPEMSPFKVHVGPIGTGNKVVQDPQIFDRLSENMRKVMGLEMEAMAMGAVAHEHADDIRYMVVMKGVMDHADEWKSDAAKRFAARASAECLLAFLRKQLPPVDRFGDILDAGTAEKPTTPAPSHLLHAKHRYIRFYEKGRAAILERLRSFCVNVRPADVWLIHGEGGMGKTRLLIEFCERLRKDGWVAGFLPKASPLERFEALVASDLPACVVIDYAEARPELASLLQSVARVKSRGAPLRVVMLARNAGDWWTMLLARESATNVLLTEHAPEALESIVPKDQRAEIVCKVAEEFAAVKGKRLPSKPSLLLEDDRFGRTLYLHLAALAWVEELPFTADSLMDEILAHEERFWVTQANVLHDAVSEGVFVDNTRRAVAAMTLCGGIRSQQAGELLLGRILPRLNDQLLAFLRRLYPGPRGTFASPLEPDLLGDAMVWRTITKQRDRGDLPTVYLDQVFQGERDRAFVTGFGLLGRLSITHADDVRPWIGHLLHGDIAGRALLALEAAKELGTKTAHAWVGYELASELERSGTVELARRLEEAVVPDGTVSLREVREWVSRTLLTLHTREDERIEAQAALAGRLIELGKDQRALGQHEAALVSTQEALDIYRKLAVQRPNTFLPDVAVSLNNLGNMQIALGMRERALVSTQEAVDINRKISDQRPDAFLPDLAESLNTLGNLQSELGKHQAGLEPMQEAVLIRRKLVEQRPDKFLSGLAMSLSNLGNLQSDLGQHDGALASAQQAVDIYRKLAAQQPDAVLPDFAGSLSNLGNRQSDLGQHETALAFMKEAVDIYRKLAEHRPEAFQPELAMSLNNLGPIQSKLGQSDAAPASIQEALDIYRELAKQRPDAFLPDVAASLFNLALCNRGLARHKEALPLAQEALDTLWPYYERFPGVHGVLIRKMFSLLTALHKELGIPIDPAIDQRVMTYLSLSGA